jgi:hypothetical protein
MTAGMLSVENLECSTVDFVCGCFFFYYSDLCLTTNLLRWRITSWVYRGVLLECSIRSICVDIALILGAADCGQHSA